MSERMDYKKAGVDIQKGERFVEAIAPLVKRTFRPEVMTGIGSFGALFKLDMSKYQNPVLVSGTDGVGTKLKVAFLADKHDTIGVDLVAMCVNDVLTSGAEPLFFLDYFASGKLRTDTAVQVVKGIVDGCEEAGCSLIGGETAEMPGFYADDEYDLSGFAVGVVNHEEIIDGTGIRPGDVLIGLHSSGLHSNGYSLVRKLLFEMKGFDVSTQIPELGCLLGEELLRPTRIYVNAVHGLKPRVQIKGMAHITGGGITGNLPRVLPEGMYGEIRKDSWKTPEIFNILQKYGNIEEDVMQITFNMGIGYIMVINSDKADETLEFLWKNKYDCSIIGVVKEGKRGTTYV